MAPLVKILDFGVARLRALATDGAKMPTLTMTEYATQPNPGVDVSTIDHLNPSNRPVSGFRA